MTHEQISRGHVPPTPTASTQAEIVFLTITFAEGGFVEHADILKAGAFDVKAEADADRYFHHLSGVHFACGAINLLRRFRRVHALGPSWIARDRSDFA